MTLLCARWASSPAGEPAFWRALQVALPSDGGHFHQAGLRFRQGDPTPSQHSSFFPNEISQGVHRSVLPFSHIHQPPKNWLINTKSYLLLLRKIPAVQRISHFLKLHNQLVAG